MIDLDRQVSGRRVVALNIAASKGDWPWMVSVRFHDSGGWRVFYGRSLNETCDRAVNGGAQTPQVRRMPGL